MPENTTVNPSARIHTVAILLETQRHIVKDVVTGEKRAVLNALRKKDFGETGKDVYTTYSRYIDALYIASYKRLKAPDDNTKTAEKTALDNLFQFLHTSVCGTGKAELYNREYADYVSMLRLSIAPDKFAKADALGANDVSTLFDVIKLTPAAVSAAARREYALHNARTALKFTDCDARVAARAAKIAEAEKIAAQADRSKFTD